MTTREAPFTGARITVDSGKTFDELRAALLAEIGDVPVCLSTDYLADSADWAAYERRLLDRVGPSGFMLFTLLDHTGWINKAGIQRKMLRAIFGNPLIAITMIRHDLKAGLFAPVEFLISEEDDDRSSITYVRPSTLIVVEPHAELLAAAHGLDDTLGALAAKVA